MFGTPVGQVDPHHRSLEDVHRSVAIPSGHWWRRLFTFAGPAYMVAVGYMDPGNWATDIEGGARFGYKLIWILLMSNMMAVLLQTLSARLGLVTGRDLAQACRDNYGTIPRWILFVLCEIAIAACDLAEVLGTAIGLNLLLGVPLIWGVLITGVDVFILLAIQRLGIRKMEAFILMLVSTIGLCFILEIFLSRPHWGGVAAGLVPGTLNRDQLYIAIGILGATVMPHNLYLHSALVQSRDVRRSLEGVAQACKFNFIDSAVALNAAFLVNAAILVVAAATFWQHGVVVTEIQQAHQMLENVLGSRVAPVAFAVALICAGQSSTVTGTLAGQITMEGFLRFRMRAWLRRLVTRSLAIIPAVLVISASGEQSTYGLLILSQVILSLQLPFAVVPLIKFTDSRRQMGSFANAMWVRILAWTVAAIIIALNVQLVINEIRMWIGSAGTYGPLILWTVVPVTGGLGLLLLWMMFRREGEAPGDESSLARRVLGDAERLEKTYRKIGVALEVGESDARMIAEASGLARIHHAEIVLMHVVEGVGGQWYGANTRDEESREDSLYVEALADELRQRLLPKGVPSVRTALGFGDVRRELAKVSQREGIDLLIMGGHGHRGLADLLHGETISGLRHELGIPILAIRKTDEG